MTASSAVADLLLQRGIRHVWCFPGGTISPLLDAIDRAGIRVLVARSEAGAGHAAQGAYRVSGRPQVVLVTSGPGVSNAITPLADAYYDSDAVVFLMGQVPTGQMRGGRAVRQRGFQETPTVDIVRPICKAVFAPLSPVTLPRAVDQALQLCVLGRPGPVVVDCPMDVQRGEAAGSWPVTEGGGAAVDWQGNADFAREVLREARSPLVIAGHGSLGAAGLVRRLVRENGWPLVASMRAVGVIPTDWPEYKGMLGHTGRRSANEAVHAADCLLVLGSRLDVRQTGTLTEEWAAGKAVIRVDVDAGEIAFSRVNIDVPCQCGVKEFLLWLNRA